TALLMWVALLEKPVVKITKYPAVLSGNGNLRMTLTGTVMYPNGSPVRDGLVTVTLNRTKNTTGTIVGVVRVSNGTFNLTAVVPEGEMPGSYHIVAHYRGYLAYSSNSDPLVTIKRVPEVELKRLNGTLAIFLNWNGNPLPNRTITVTVGNLSLNLTTDETGYAYLRIGNATGTVRIVYRGDDLYLPLNETLKIPPVENGKETTSSESGAKHSLNISRIMKLVSGLLLAVGIAYVVLKRKNLPELPLQSPQVFREPLRVLSPARRVSLPNEPVRVVLNRPAEAFLDGEPLGRGDAFELRPGAGTHVFSAEDVSFEFHVLPAREAVIKAYNLHFLPYVESLGVPTERRTPFEIVRALRSKGRDDPALETIASLFVLADYAERPLENHHFLEFVEALEKLGVFGDGEE
ncbi:MAG: carboxypeptidase-like regulatory domain-containing protein, partial [Thermococcus sp.]